MCPNFGQTDSPSITFTKLFLTCQNLNFVNDEIWAGFPKLGRANLTIKERMQKIYYRALRNHNRIVFEEMSSWTVLTMYLGINTTF